MDLNEHVSNYITYNCKKPLDELEELIEFLRDVPISWADGMIEETWLRDHFYLTASEHVPDATMVLEGHMTEEQSDKLSYYKCATLMVQWCGEHRLERPRLDEIFSHETDEFHTVWGMCGLKEKVGGDGYETIGPDKTFLGLFYKLDGDEDYRYLEIFFWEPSPE